MATRTAITPVFNNGPGVASIATAAYNQPAGDTITVRITLETDTPSAVTVTIADVAGNSFTPRNVARDGGNFQHAQLFDCINCLGDANNVITATIAGDTAQKVGLVVDRWTPAGTITFNAQPAGATNTSNSPATAAFSAGDFAVAVAHFWSTLTSAAAGWTTAGSNTEGAGFYRNDSPGGNYAAGATLGTSDLWTIAAASYLDTVSSVSITDVDTDEIVIAGQTGATITGTNLGATTSDRVLTLEQGSVAVTQTQTSGNATGGVFNVVMEPGGAALKFGAVTAKVTIVADSSIATLAATVNPAAGELYVDVGTPNTTSAFRISSSPDIASGDQIHVRGVGGGAAPVGLVLYSDGTFSGATDDFDARVWSASDQTWGSWATQTVIPLPLFDAAIFDGPALFDTGAGAAAALEAAPAAQASISASLTTGIRVAGAVAAVASATAGLTTAIRMAASVAAVTTIAAALTTAIRPSAAAAAQASISASLSTGIRLAAAPAAQASITGTLQSNAAALAATPSVQASISAALSTGIPLVAAPAAQASITAALQSNAAALAATPTGQVSITADLTTAIQISAAPANAVSLTGALSTQIPLAAASAGQATLAGALSTGIRLQAAPLALAALSAAITTQIQMAAAPAAVSAISATLAGTSAPMAATPSAVASLTAALTTGIPLASAASSAVGVTASLTTGIRLASVPSVAATMSAALTVGSGSMVAAPGAACSLMAELTTSIRLAATPAAAVTLTAALLEVGFSERRVIAVRRSAREIQVRRGSRTVVV